MATGNQEKKFDEKDPRSRWTPDYVLIKEYPGFIGKTGLLVSKEGYAKNGVIPIAEDCTKFPEFWHETM